MGMSVLQIFIHLLRSASSQGTYLGTLQHVNHLDLVGWINTARYKWAEMMGKEIKFRPATFYLGIADMLAGEVEGVPKDGEEGGERQEGEMQEVLDEAREEGKVRPEVAQAGTTQADDANPKVGKGVELNEGQQG